MDAEEREDNIEESNYERMQHIMETISSITPKEMRKLKDPDLFRYAAKYNNKSAMRKVAVEELAKAGKFEVLEYLAATARHKETRFGAVDKLASLKQNESLKRIIEHSVASRGNTNVAVRCANCLYRMRDMLIEQKDLEGLAWVSKFATKQKARQDASRWMDRIRRVVRLKRFDSGYM